MKSPHHYDLADFTDDGSLRLSAGLWLVLIYLSRYVVIIGLGTVSSFISARRGLDLSGLATLYSSPEFLLASIPALLVIAASIKRLPEGGRLVRLIWRNGRGLLICSILLDLCLLYLHLPQRVQQVSSLYILGSLVDIHLLVYLSFSSRVRDTFADFPAASVVPDDRSDSDY